MKYVLMISVMLIGLLPTLTHANEDKPKQSAVLSTAIAKYEIRADGLACPYCAYGIEKKFKAIKGVKNIDVDLKVSLSLFHDIYYFFFLFLSIYIESTCSSQCF